VQCPFLFHEKKLFNFKFTTPTLTFIIFNIKRVLFYITVGILILILLLFSSIYFIEINRILSMKTRILSLVIDQAVQICVILKYIYQSFIISQYW
jgi:ABC-type multidrug transport system permease subunit